MKNITFCAILLILVGCTPKMTNPTTTKSETKLKNDHQIELVLLQANDVYQISPSASENTGGMARLAAFKQDLLVKNPNTYFCLAGDFLNPSVIGTIRYKGKAISGAQMVAAMNASGVDLVTFGNHEFDLKQSELQSRLNESQFDWITNNAFLTDGTLIQPFYKQNSADSLDRTSCAPHKIVKFKDADGTELKVGFFGTVLPSNKKPYVLYKDVYEECRNSVKELEKKGADIIVGLTHVAIDDDKEIAKQNPNLLLVMGGHEHVNMLHTIGNVKIAKADANGKTVWVHRISFNTKTKMPILQSELVKMDEKMREDADAAKVVADWEHIADSSMRAQGFVPDQVVTELNDVLDAREVTNRFQQTQLGEMIGNSMAVVAKQKVDCAFFNSGSIRLDDEVRGKLTQKDIISILPYGGNLVECDIRGDELRKVLGGGLMSRARGGYLQWYNVKWVKEYDFLINGEPLDLTKTYHIITSGFLLSGQEHNLDFFNEKNPLISNISKPDPADKKDLRNDIRLALIQFLQKK